MDLAIDHQAFGERRPVVRARAGHGVQSVVEPRQQDGCASDVASENALSRDLGKRYAL
jgi:hypothetical protein